MAKHKLTDVVAKIVDLLNPFDSEERRRTVSAAFMILGEESVQTKGGRQDNESDGDAGSLPSKAKIWLKQNNLNLSEIEKVFHIDGENVDVIAGMIPGKNKKAQSHNAYVLQGICSLLSSGEASFADKSARSLCEKLGCYDGANHSVNMRKIDNRLTGAKAKGWKLTAPGLTNGAALVKEIVEKTK